MTRAFSTDGDDLVAAERDVRRELGSLDLDIAALAAVSNIFRVATAVRKHMEGSVLAERQLSWSAFVVLFVLRIWGEHDSGQLADEAGITNGTLTGVVKTLESRGLVTRRADEVDRRRVIVAATDEGRRVVDDVMPAFNLHEALVTRDLGDDETLTLARLLRAVLRTVESLDPVASRP
jgi:MarR family transcriptional regulator, organic hydroperoxide resistance regulator